MFQWCKQIFTVGIISDNNGSDKIVPYFNKVVDF